MGGVQAHLRRLTAALAAAGLSCLTVITIAGGPAPVLAGNCSKSKPATDTAVTQSSSGATVGGALAITYVVTAENEGPCATTNVVVTDWLPAGVSSVSSLTVNPSSGTCGITTTSEVQCTFAKLSSPSDANTNNPGTAIVTLTVSGLSGTATNIATVSSDLPETDGDVSCTNALGCFTGNNISYGAFIDGGGTLTYPFDAFGQSTNINIPPGYSGGAEIEQNVQAPPCPRGVSCFSKPELLNSDDIFSGGTAAVQQLVFDVPIVKGAPQSATKVVVLHLPKNASQWQTVPACTSITTPAPDPCVGSVVKTKINSVAYFVITVYTQVTSKWVF